MNEKPLDYSTLTKEQFDAEIEKGIADIKAGRVYSADEVEEEILKGNFSIYYMDKLDEAIEILILDENESVADFNRYLVDKIEEYTK